MQPNTLFFLTAAVLAVATTVYGNPASQLPKELDLMPDNGLVTFMKDRSSSPGNGSLAEILTDLNLETK